MTAVQFYHLTATPLERALPKLLEKAYGGGFRTLVLADSPEYAAHLNDLLWTYDPASFLPHGSEQDGNAAMQPILLSTRLEPVNNASLAVITNGASPDSPERFGRILDIFDGNNPQAIEEARKRWAEYKQKGHELSYLRQNASGGWEKKEN